MSSSTPPIRLRLGISPCPNDTFMFHALLHGETPARGVEWETVFCDIEELNARVFREELDVAKVSFHALGSARERYALLATGAALGRGCGPLLVARDAGGAPLEERRVAIPGWNTSATLLLRLFAPAIPRENLIAMPFDRILASCERGDVDAGLIIHESRFTYRAHGLTSIVDLGGWWEETSGLPIPLGGITIRRDLPEAIQREVERALGESVRYARSRPEASRAFVESHAQETEREVQARHIDLYVNDFSVELGSEGAAAIEAFFRAAEERELIPPYAGGLFVGDA